MGGLTDIRDLEVEADTDARRRAREAAARKRAETEVRFERNGRGIRVGGLPELGEAAFDYLPKVRAPHQKVIDTLDDEGSAVLASTSLLWWRRRAEQDWRRWIHRRHRPERMSLTRYAIDQGMRGSGGCDRTWQHCDYCEHGRAMEAVAKYLSDHRPRTFVTFRPADPDLSPDELIVRVGACFDYYRVLADNGLPSAALIVPSIRSSDPELHGNLHAHVLVDGRFSFGAMQNVAAAMQIQLSWRSTTFPDRPHPAKVIARTDRQAHALAYAVEQVTTTDRDAALPYFRTWPWNARNEAATRTDGINLDLLRDDFARAIEADRRRFQRRNAR